MNAIEIRNLTKTFGEKVAVNGLNMTVPEGAIYGFIGENGSGKSTTEKIITGLIHPTQGEIKLYGKPHTDIDVRSGIGVLIEQPGCYPNYSVWNNLMLHATNLGIQNREDEVRRVLTLVRMEGAASNKYKNCSLGMKQRIGIAMALLGKPTLLILDEPINGLDADGMRIMREILLDITKNHKCTVLVSSHLLNELEKVATHYGIIRNGRMIVEMTSAELENSCPRFVYLKANNLNKARELLQQKYKKVEYAEQKQHLRVYDAEGTQAVVKYLYDNGIVPTEVGTDKIGLEEYYINLMEKGVK